MKTRRIAFWVAPAFALIAAVSVAPSGSGLALADGAAGAPSLVERARSSRIAYTEAIGLADQVGARMAGAPSAERAVAWVVRELSAMGLARVHTEPVVLTPWSRGAADRVELVAPYSRSLRALALGSSAATPPAGVTASVVEVKSFDELKALGNGVANKIVFYDPVMQRVPTFAEYGRVVPMRLYGAIGAAKRGAVGAIVRSVGTGSHRLAHAGVALYKEGVPAIPFAAIASEDAALLHRVLARGQVQVRLVIGGGPRAPITSANVVAEVRGTEKPDEIVLIGAHLDSWDVGDGALDDGAGVGIAMQTMALAQAMKPRRTVRLVLFMDEEQGLAGAKAYAETHAAELGKHVAAIEADEGAGAPLHFRVNGDTSSLALVTRLAQPLASLTTSGVVLSDDAGADLTYLREAGVPAVELDQDATDYFEWHHTDGDTADKIDPIAYARSAAAISAMVLQLANSDEVLPRSVPKSD